MVKFLCFLPKLFEVINCQHKIDILLQIYRSTPIDQWTSGVKKSPFLINITAINCFNNNLQVIDKFMSYAKLIMCDETNHFGYPLLMNIFTLYCKCLDFTKKESLDDLTDHLYRNFLEATSVISQVANTSKKKNKKVVVRSFP